MKTTTIYGVARYIRANRAQFEAIMNDFRAYWGKIYRGEVSAAMNDILERLKTDPKNDELKRARYALEQVCAKIKGITVPEDIANDIRTMHDDDKLTFSCLRADYILTSLNGLDYVANDDEGKPYLRELRKADKTATERTWEPVVKWTEAKVAKYLRLATIRINEQSK